MNKTIIGLILILLTVCHAFGQQSYTNYAATGIADSLKKDADAVYRLNESIVEIVSPSKFIFSNHEVITLLNKEAAYHLHQSIEFDKSSKIETFVVKIYNEAGLPIRTYQKKDFQQKDYDDQTSFYNDHKLLYNDIQPPGYPCTIEITVKQIANGYVELPDLIVSSPKHSLEKFTYIVKVPSSLSIHYRSVNSELKPLITKDAETTTYSWITQNIPAIKGERNTYTNSYLPRIEIVPGTFEYDGYKGALKTWQQFGAWNYPFYEDEKGLDKDETDKVNELVARCKTDVEKIQTLYNYLQQTTRYVSIQLGIGGFKPFPANYVSYKKYGDCKALTNYMRYLLKAAGIKAFPALVNAKYNNPPADISFPSDPFNHVILCVPLHEDSVWLECTSRNNSAGFLGSFTENKNVLLITDKGGVLVKTPASNYRNNVLNTKTVITLKQDGSSEASSNIFCTGDVWNFFYEITKLNSNDMKNVFINYLHYKTPEHFSAQLQRDSANGKIIEVNMHYDQQYDFKTAGKLFFKPRLANLSDEDIQPVSDRKYEYLFEFPYVKNDTTVYLLSPGTIVDKLPAKKEFSNEYASFKNEYIVNQNAATVSVCGQLIVKKHVILAKDYLLVANFFREVNRAENEKFILLEK